MIEKGAIRPSDCCVFFPLGHFPFHTITVYHKSCAFKWCSVEKQCYCSVGQKTCDLGSDIS